LSPSDVPERKNAGVVDEYVDAPGETEHVSGDASDLIGVCEVGTSLSTNTPDDAGSC
jgi:hypothetical protein